MLRKLLATAIVCGFAAGIFISVIQSVWVTPLIYRAETFEAAAGAGPSHPGEDAAVPAPAAAEAEPWAPADGVERVFFTVLANILSGIGFALLLAGVAATQIIAKAARTNWIAVCRSSPTKRSSGW